MYRLIAFALALLAPVCAAFAEHSVKISIARGDGSTETREIALKNAGKFERLEIPKESIPADATSLTVSPDFAKAAAGENGYILYDNGIITEFKRRKDDALERKGQFIQLSGMKTERETFAAIVKGMRFDHNTMATLKNGVYALSYTFGFKRYPAYQNIIIDFYFLSCDDADYSGMARAYRNYQIEENGLRPLRERAKEHPSLAYAASAPEVRIRLAWKPAPSPVPDQTLANEPKLIVKATFGRVGQIIDAMKTAGIERAQICLVGWNRMGHDGRYPQLFPVEPQLGGEEKLKELIKKAQAAGYQIVCHTNSTSAYPVSEIWDESYVAKNKNGKIWERNPNREQWSGGRSYFMSMKPAYEKFAVNDFPKIAALGFKGIFYHDVISCLPPPVDYDKNHPLNADESAQYQNKIMALARQTFGGAQSEGPYDHVAKNMDSSLYAGMYVVGTNRGIAKHYEKPLADKIVPIWQLVYNGIILNNASSETINYPIKGTKSVLKVEEYDSRPTFYLYSDFYAGHSWMGTQDLKADTPEELAQAVAAIKGGFDTLEKRGYLQYEFMQQHDFLSENVTRSTFSDGSEIICNYSDRPFKYRGKFVAPTSSQLRKPALLQHIENLF